MDIKAVSSSRWFHVFALFATVALGVLVEVTTPGSAVHLVWAPTVIALLTAARPLWGSVMARDVFGPQALQWAGVFLAAGGTALTAWLTKSGLVAAPVAVALVTQLRIALTAAPAPGEPPGPPAPPAGLLLLLALGVTLPAVGCAHVGDVVSAIEDCTDPLICDLGDKVKPTALAVLTCSGLAPEALPACALEGLGALATVIGKDGPAVVDCLMHRLASSRAALPGAVGDEALVARRAAAYVGMRKNRGVKLRLAP